MGRILVVDDEDSMREFLRILLEKDGHEVTTAGDGVAGLAVATRQEVDLIISDIKMPRLDGVGLLTGLRQRDLKTPVILVTAYASSDSAIQAMKHGAFDYLTKPFKVDEIRPVIQRALTEAEAERRHRDEPTPPLRPDEPALRGILGRSPRIVEVYKLISRVAAVDSTVLITGESGTGKELVARTIHLNSPRSGRQFLAINCGAIPEQLLESELFGHVKGSFTGAVANKAGLLEVAQGGTVLLDEVAEMSPMLQVKLLRFLQDHIFRRVGGTEDIGVDVRILAATNKNLASLIQQGLFREDLYYRLNVISVKIPPLRERRQDVPLLAEHFLALFAKRAGRSTKRLAPDAMELLTLYAWPGNVRELENLIERAVALTAGEEVGAESLPPGVRTCVEVPPLRERPEDIPLLAEYFLGSVKARTGRQAIGLAPEALEVLTAHTWPGNVRELEKVIAEAVAQTTGDEVQVESLPRHICQPPLLPALPRVDVPAEGLDMERVVADLEKSLMWEALEKTGWVQTKAAQLLGINFRSFRYRAKKYGLDRHIRDRNHADS